MSAEAAGLILGAAGVIISSLITGTMLLWGQKIVQRAQVKIARDARAEAGIARKNEYYRGLMERLTQASTQYQSWLGETLQAAGGTEDKATVYRSSDAGQQKHSEIISVAIAACFASGDEKLTKLALNKKRKEKGKVRDGLCPYQIPPERIEGRIYYDENRDAILYAIKRLAFLINETTDVKEVEGTPNAE